MAHREPADNFVSILRRRFDFLEHSVRVMRCQNFMSGAFVKITSAFLRRD